MQCPVCRSASLGGGAIAGISIAGFVAISVPVLIFGKVLCPQVTAFLHCAGCCLAAQGDSDLRRASQPLSEITPSGTAVVVVCMCRVACRLAGMPEEEVSRMLQFCPGLIKLHEHI